LRGLIDKDIIMTEEGLNASILRLQSHVIETYGMIKDIYRREQQEGDVDKIAQLCLKLANYEGGLLTLKGYKQDIIDSAKVEQETEPVQIEPEQDAAITEEYLEENSKTFRNSQAHQKKRKKKK
tara:strand:+ start:1827 stop:2198 length:372 start_codon:yes stop_codon:yes gene_type:complete